jgi:hypothetical protein
VSSSCAADAFSSHSVHGHGTQQQTRVYSRFCSAELVGVGTAVGGATVNSSVYPKQSVWRYGFLGASHTLPLQQARITKLLTFACTTKKWCI